MHEGFDTTLAVSGANFAADSWISVEGDAVDAPVKLKTAFKSETLLLASTTADSIPYRPQSGYSLRVTNAKGGFTDLYARAETVDASVQWMTKPGLLGKFRTFVLGALSFSFDSARVAIGRASHDVGYGFNPGTFSHQLGCR